VPFFLDWKLQDVKVMMDQVCIYARMHQFSAVCDWLIEHYQEFPELTCSVLTHAFVDIAEAQIPVRQGVGMLKVFTELLTSRLVSRAGLARIAVGTEVALLMEHPPGLSAYLAQKEHRLLGDLLEAMSRYVESATVKQSMVATLSLTAGKFYKPLQEQDSFVLRILDMAPPLLEGEFEWFLPVLHHLARVGGFKVKTSIINKKLHMRLARMMEDDVVALETALRTKEGIPVRDGPHLNAAQRLQWYLIVFTVLASGASSAPSSTSSKASNQNLHFDAFICVDLLPVLVRILKVKPHPDVALCVGFLLSSVSASPCIVPHMLAILNTCEKSFPAALVPEEAQEIKPIASADWTPYTPPQFSQSAVAQKRNLLNLLTNAGHLPSQNPALLQCPRMLQYFKGLKSRVGVFDNPSAPLHCKLYLLAHVCDEGRPEVQELLEQEDIMEMLSFVEDQLVADGKNINIALTLFEPCDLRIVWIHAVISVAKHSGIKRLKNFNFTKRVLTAISWTEDILRSNHKSYKDVGTILECQQALALAVSPLSVRADFGTMRERYTLFLLNLMCSAPLLSLRLSACDCLIHMLDKGYSPEICAGAFLKTSCLEAFNRIIGGPMDDLAAACCRVIISFVKTDYYRIHVHLLGTLDTIAAMLGSPTSTSNRIQWLAEVFLVLTNQRTEEVIDAAVELPTVAPFLGLAREKTVRKRELVQLWLEELGSSLYEIDDVTSAFQTSSFHGYLYVASRCVLEPAQAQDLRRIIFGVIYKRIQKWRATAFGISDFYTTSLLNATLPMCERQPDLVAACLALFHSFLSNGETEVLARIWEGGHYVWLCKRLQHKSRAQVRKMNAEPTASNLRNAWPYHKDLTVTQGMTLRVLSELCHMFPVDVCDKTVDCGVIVDIVQEYLQYYIHFDWPSQEGRDSIGKDVEQATESILELAMQYLDTCVSSVNKDQQVTFVQQGMLGLCLMVLLPSPENQKRMRTAIVQDGETWQVAKDFPEPSLFILKMLAGTVASRLTHIQDVFKKVEEQKYAHQTIAMFAHLHHLSPLLFDKARAGSVSVPHEVMLEEKCATLYLYLCNKIHINWMITNLGAGCCETLCSLMLDFWHRHWNREVKHHGLRIFSTFCQAHVLYCSILSDDGKARRVMEAIHRMFGDWDPREYRHVLRLLNVSMAFALKIPALPGYISSGILKSLKSDEAASLRKIMQEGGEMQSNQNAAKQLLLVSFVSQIILRCEHPGDTFGRVWGLWFVLTTLAHANPEEAAPEIKPGQPPPPVSSLTEPQETFMRFQSQVDKEKLARRARMLAEIEAAKPGKKESGPLGPSIAFGKEDMPPTCLTNWMRTSPQISAALAKTVGKSISFLWRESNQIGVVAAARLLYELPLFLETAAFALEGRSIMTCLQQVEKSIQLGTITLGAVITSMRLPLRAHTLTGDFLKQWYDLQEDVIEGFVGAGEGPYDLLASWLRRGLNGDGSNTSVDLDFKSLIAFIIGQGLAPPLAVVPSLNLDTAERPDKAPGGGKNVVHDTEDASELPLVAECPPPPEALLNRVAQEVLYEDLRLRQNQDRGEGPLFSSSLCHLLYALAVMVPQHAQAAAHSADVRGAAFSQLIKVQNIIACGVKTKSLYESADGARMKLFLYVRIAACIRGALQSIMGSWFAADFGASFAINDEGGRDFVQYCTKHVIQVYNNKMALTKVLGTPWERMMLTQGPTATIADLLLVLCSSDANLKEVGGLGGQQALLCLSRYGESAQVRQQATMLLTKLAVLGFANPVAGKTMRGDLRT
jgi:hypothetical protein